MESDRSPSPEPPYCTETALVDRCCFVIYRINPVARELSYDPRGKHATSDFNRRCIFLSLPVKLTLETAGSEMLLTQTFRKGRKIKSIDRCYNKENARLQSIKDLSGIKGSTHRQAALLNRRNLEVVEQEESHTSQASSLDGDPLPVWNTENPVSCEFSSKRIKRGLHRTALGWAIDADANGALNLLRKQTSKLDEFLGQFRGCFVQPLRVNFP
jgi:hypothetical protein